MKKLFLFILFIVLSLMILGGCDGINIPPIIGTPSTSVTPTPTSVYTPPPTTGTGAIYGSIVDEVTGAFLDGVIVKIDGQIATTSVDGSYSITGLSSGTHTLTLEKEGYQTLTVTITIPPGNASVQYNAYMR